MTPEQQAMQRHIMQQLNVTASFDVELEVRQRTGFLASYLKNAGLKTFVLGVSGGVDSLAAGLLAYRAVQQLRASDGYQARLVVLCLPYGEQRDAADAQACTDLIQPDQVLVTNIQPASDALLDGLIQQGLVFNNAGHRDFVLGNIKARQRMVALFAAAGAQSGLVVGTDQAAESLVGFFTKFGDGAADIVPLAGLNKRRVQALARHLGAPDSLVNKVPTADLESLSPLRPDEDAFGVTYDDIDDFLEGRPVSLKAYDIIVGHWRASSHKRQLPAAPAFQGAQLA